MYAKLDSDLEKSFVMTDFPLNIAVEPTNHCNLNCIMCNNDKLTRPKGFMETKTYKRIIDEVAQENKNTRIWLDFYGEAMLTGFKLFYMIDYAKKKGLTNICINTNGQIMREEYADMLLDSGVDYISLDCDGFSKEVYESIRRKGDRDTFYKNTEYLLNEKSRRNANVIIDVKVIDMPENHNEVEKIIKYWKERGAWTAVRRESRWVGEGDSDANSSEQDRIVCGHAVGITAISWDGMMSKCVFDYDIKMPCGNIFEHSIKEMWKQRNEDFLKLHFEHRWDELPRLCQFCPDWKNVGEIRYDEHGNAINRNYDSKEKIFS